MQAPASYVRAARAFASAMSERVRPDLSWPSGLTRTDRPRRRDRWTDQPSRFIASLDEGIAQDLKVSNLPIDGDQSRRQQLVHVMAGCVAGVADVDDLANLGEGQAGGPAAANEVQP